MKTSKTKVTCSFYGKIKSKPFKSFKSLENTNIILYEIFLPEYYNLIKYSSNYLESFEIKRAENYFKEKDKQRFIVCRILLKCVLAIHTNLDIKKIHINLHKNKKPYLSSHPELFFNISHSENCAIIAIANTPIGVDIESINKNFDFQEILPNIYSKKEITLINNSIDKNFDFYNLWTRKEAFVKASGKGIDDDFPNINCLDGLNILKSSITNSKTPWLIHSFKINKDYIGAVAYTSQSSIPRNLSFLTLPKNVNDLQILVKKHII